MLADPRAAALVDEFRRAVAVAAQPAHRRRRTPICFPEFDDNLREALQQETELFLDDQLRADRSVVELLTADYTFLNERLARHYGIPNVYGSHFRRVTYPDDRRGGTARATGAC